MGARNRADDNLSRVRLGVSALTCLATAAASLLLGGCVSEETQVRSERVVRADFVTTNVLPEPPPRVAVVLRERNGKLGLEAHWVAVCNRRERIRSRPVKVKKKKVHTATQVFSGVFATAGLTVYMWPDLDAQNSLEAGTILVVIAAIPYSIAATQASETTEQLPPRDIERDASPGPCSIGAAEHQPVSIEGANGILRGQTDARGLVEFESTLAPPLRVELGGHLVEKVEWAK